MGQGQSQPRVQQVRPPTPEEDRMDPEERTRLQAEQRELRAAALEKRLASQQKRGNGTGTATPPAIAAGKKMSALEQMSKENKGWRDADEQADLRAYN